MVNYKAELVLQMDSILGEGPVWHPIHQKLYWVDIEKKELHTLEPDTRQHTIWPAPKRVSAVVPAKNGNLILALQGEIVEMDLASGAFKTLVELESYLPDNRCNDGKCDAAGRFWVGTMNVDCNLHEGSLYCIDQTYHITKVLENLTIANGMGWSPDGDKMYFIDSHDHNVKSFQFKKDRCALVDGQIIFGFDNKNELPDGMCVDAEGMLWIAFWGGSRVGRYDPATGSQLAEILIPATQVTSCCFGGEDLKTLFITTARQGLSQAEIDQYPLSGSLFASRVQVRGSQTNFFR